LFLLLCVYFHRWTSGPSFVGQSHVTAMRADVGLLLPSLCMCVDGLGLESVDRLVVWLYAFVAFTNNYRLCRRSGCQLGKNQGVSPVETLSICNWRKRLGPCGAMWSIPLFDQVASFGSLALGMCAVSDYI